MTRKYIQPGEVIDYTNSSGSQINVDSIVVIGGRLGVALVDIPDGETGSVQISGVMRLPKVSGTAINQGDKIDYDASEAAVTTGIATPATGDVTQCAFAWTDADAADTEADVLLGFPGGTVN